MVKPLRIDQRCVIRVEKVFPMTRPSLPRCSVDDGSNVPKHLTLEEDSDALRPRPDWAFRVLVTALFAVAVWLLAMPWVPSIARCTMQRFHLKTDSFVTWAIQQPIPPMYSFANTTEVRTEPPGNVAQKTLAPRSTEPFAPGVDQRSFTENEPTTEVLAARMINHFPTREFTFANARVRYLRDQSSKWFVFRSTYRGQSVESVYRLDPATKGGWNVTLTEGNEAKMENRL